MWILKLLLPAAVLVYGFYQVRKPSRWGGRPFVWLMNLSHSKLTDWGLEHVRIDERDTILDVGCGGGRTVAKLASRAVKGSVYGVDYAAGSVAASRGKNAQAIREGRVEILQAAVSQLPFPDATFDLVSAVETQYYWPDLAGDMREILRVLKPAGRLIVIAESYKGGARDKLQGPVMTLLGARILGVDEQRELFSAAGFADFEVFEEPSKGWICAIGTKPS